MVEFLGQMKDICGLESREGSKHAVVVFVTTLGSSGKVGGVASGKLERGVNDNVLCCVVFT